MKINLIDLHRYEDEKLVRKQKHPTEDLYIINYTESCQFDKKWDEFTTMCRGLVIDKHGKILAKPFPKFFNLGEHEQEHLDNVDITKPHKVFEKLDGSLGITYWINDIPYLATRGSFDSDQAKKGTQLLQNNKELMGRMKPHITYLFEIIYPTNRIVVDYGKQEKLVLLGAYEYKTGTEVPYNQLKTALGDSVEYCDIDTDFLQATAMYSSDNKEGFVIRFEDGLRIKYKFEEYVRLHRLVTGVTARRIWDMLRNDESLDELLVRVPDEFYDWVNHTKSRIEDSFRSIEMKCIQDFSRVGIEVCDEYNEGKMDAEKARTELRKEFALKATQCDYPKILFLMLDDKPYEHVIWSMIRPQHETPFLTII